MMDDVLAAPTSPVVIEGPVAAVGKYARNSRKQRATRGPRAGTRRGDGWRRSAADEAVLSWAGRFGVISQHQAATYFYDGGMETARRRIAFMRRAGLVQVTDNVRWAGPVVWPTSAGMQAGGVEGLDAPGMPSEERLLHKLLVGDTCLDLHARGLALLSERQIRSLELAPDPTVAAEYAQHLGLSITPMQQNTPDGPRSRWFTLVLPDGSLHYPDALAVNGGRLLAIEVEVTPKKQSRLFAAIRAYQASARTGHINWCSWFVTRDVRVQLEGAWVRQLAGKAWRNGLLQEARVLPDGPPDWTQKGLPVAVRAISSRDEGVQYAIDQRTLDPVARSSHRVWRARRALWMRDVPEVDFTTWISMPGKLDMARARGL